MSMLIPGQNQLAEPAIIAVDAFEPLLAQFKAFVIDYVAARAPQSAAKLKVSLDNESELLSLALEAFCVRLQTHERQYNARIKQMLAWWATGSNLDARLADIGPGAPGAGPGDPAAFPPVPPTLESDDDARLRYYLAPHAPAAGSRMQYRREVFTLGERPAVNVESATPGVVKVTYTFDPDGYAAQVKDGSGRRTAPGEVMVTVLSRDGDGSASADLLDGVRRHFARPDVRPETDLVTVQSAQIQRYKIRVVAKINAGPDSGLTQVGGATLAANLRRILSPPGRARRPELDRLRHPQRRSGAAANPRTAGTDCLLGVPGAVLHGCRGGGTHAMSEPKPSLLPANSSPLEKALDLGFGRLLERIMPPFPALMNPLQTPSEFLPYLAADRGVSEWDAGCQRNGKAPHRGRCPGRSSARPARPRL